MVSSLCCVSFMAFVQKVSNAPFSSLSTYTERAAESSSSLKIFSSVALPPSLSLRASVFMIETPFWRCPSSVKSACSWASSSVAQRNALSFRPLPADFSQAGRTVVAGGCGAAALGLRLGFGQQQQVGRVRHLADELLAETRKGRAVVSTKPGVRLAVVREIAPEHDHVAVIGENRKLVIFALSEVPLLARGQGVTLQRYKDGGMADVVTLRLEDGLSWAMGGDSGRTRTEKDLLPWKVARGAAGRLPPNGFPRDNRF